MPRLEITAANAPPLERESDGAVRVRGTRVSLDSVVGAFNEGCTPEEIAQDYPTLHLADIYSVIAFYLRHRDEVHAHLQERQVQAEELRREIEKVCPPDGFRERLLARQAQKSCLPP